jgi:hypothetical protein
MGVSVRLLLRLDEWACVCLHDALTMCVLRLDDDAGGERRGGRGGGGNERPVREEERVSVLMCVCIHIVLHSGLGPAELAATAHLGSAQSAHTRWQGRLASS